MSDPVSDEERRLLQGLYPSIEEDEVAELAEWYASYATLIGRIYQRISSDPTAWQQFQQLTSGSADPTMTREVATQTTHQQS